MLLSYLWQKEVVPYFIIGFFLVAYLKLDIMFIAIIGGCLATIYIFNTSKKEEAIDD
ncbi:PTS sugar transporter subunit IIC [Desnuesiella massiliensis]|nr:PTS sugar transporter subunit IIC [Desnuesiella massiliensis]